MTQTTLNYLQNRNLFSNHYLELLIVDEPVWQEDVTEAFKRAKEIYSSRKDSWKNLDESMLEQFLIKPILEEVLGHYYIPQAKVEKGSRRPDYAFFMNEASLSEALENKESDDLYLKAIAVGDAKKWRVLLDKKVKGSSGSFEFQNPSYQIDQYLHLTQVQWGILTNGHQWRIYYRETSYKLDSYYDVDLVTILETNDVEAFKYFYLFFRCEAFVKGPDDKNFLDQVYDGSVKYAKELGDSLQKNVYEAMEILSKGFFSRKENGLTPDEHTLAEVQENTLRLLYRLMFIFYAESRKLLDIGNPVYQALSLQSIKYDIANKIDNRELILPVTTDYWNKLDTLFALINEGSESEKFQIPKDTLYVPAYNGGMFNPDRNPFLYDKKVGDEFIARAIDLMAREDNEFIDYSTLGTRQLGSVYEGLLEYKLKVAEEDLVAIKEKGREKWVLKKDAQGKKNFDEVPAGEIFLATDKAERKATGSYYTPDYIVKYIVRSTLDPILDKKRKSWGESGLGERPFLHDILDIKVLDPAMGSGHFLVEACEFLANKLVWAWGEARPEDLESEEVAEHDVHWARREVVRHCIYGVDLNPMAVELAKLSLWLETVATNKPLTFLDHHLKVGNSLIGAEIKNLKSLPSMDKEEEAENGIKQPTLWDFTVKGHFDKLLEKYGEFASHPDDDLTCVKQKEQEYDALQKSELNRRIHELANVWISTYFSVVPPPDEYVDLQNEMNPNSYPNWSHWRGQEWFRRAQDVAGEKSFFHWELEFPEVYYERGAQKENPGWDAVVGNPPYIRAELADKADRKFLMVSPEFRELYGRFDVYLAFIEKSIKLTSLHGFFSMITPDAILTINYAEKIRKWLINNYTINSILDLSSLQVFKEVAVTPTILVISKRKSTEKTDVEIRGFSVERNEFFNVTKIPVKFFSEMPKYSFHLDLSENAMCLKKKIDNVCIHLGTICYTITGFVGHDSKTGASKDRLIHIDKVNDDCKPYIEAKEWSGRYSFVKPIRYFEYLPQVMHRPKFVELFESSKILVQRLATGNRIISTLDYNKIYVNHVLNCCVKLEDVIHLGNKLNIDLSKLKPDSRYNIGYIQSLIGSLLIGYYHNCFLSPGLDVFPETMRQLPIRRISFNTPADRRTSLVEEANALYSEYLGAPDHIDRLLDFVLSRLAAEPEESDVVHDLLAYLAECMIDMNKEKNVEIKAFLDFLEGEVGTAVDKMTNKTALKEYYNHEFQKLIDILVKNKKKLKEGYDPKSPTNYKHLNEWYADSIDKLHPLMERIEITDRLIDQIVYRLYGLTTEEIKIVEESIT